ncbi:MAG: sodium:calcium antiporter [Chloroflexota bacterium]
MDLVVLLGAFVVILLGAELFTNGIEWFGRKLNLAEGAVGSVLAAIGTALPETLIPVIAILFTSGAASREVGIGAILGAPFMLSTLAMFVTGIAVVWAARRRPTGDAMLVDTAVLGHDVRYFALAYAIAIGAAFLPADVAWLKWVVAVVLLGIYAWYVKGHFTADAKEDADELERLRFHPLDRGAHQDDPAVPRLRVVSVQVVVALGMIVLGAAFFVDAVTRLANDLQVDSLLLALIVAPIATELPETFNSVLWVRQGKDTLAMGNVTGAMVFQSTIPTVVALVFASSAWTVDAASSIAFASAGIAFLSMALIFVPMVRHGTLHGRRLLIGAPLYVAYLALVVAVVTGVLGGASATH